MDKAPKLSIKSRIVSTLAAIHLFIPSIGQAGHPDQKFDYQEMTGRAQALGKLEIESSLENMNSLVDSLIDGVRHMTQTAAKLEVEYKKINDDTTLTSKEKQQQLIELRKRITTIQEQNNNTLESLDRLGKMLEIYFLRLQELEKLENPLE